MPWRSSLLLFCTLALPATLFGQAPARIPILVDTDIGSDIDDAFAIGFILGSQELEVRGVTTVAGNTQQRAMMLCRFFTMTGRRHLAVAAGADPQPARSITGQHQYYYHPDALFDRTKKPEKLTAAEFLLARIKAQPGKVTVLALGPLTNIARMLADKPDAAKDIQRIVLLEVNLKRDPAAAKAVFASGVPLIVVSEAATAGLKLSRDDVKRVFAPGTALSRQVEALYQLWDQPEPPLDDVLAAALCFKHDLTTLTGRSLDVDEKGVMSETKGKPNAQLVAALRTKSFVKWYVERVAALVAPADRPSVPIATGAMPYRVHVAEDYETDIERRWWMSGKAETANVPQGKRACRGVLTHDFDDLLMASRQMYTAVIFNPVPGPPMGRNTRLSFRCWLKGTDTLRVQIYSLTNGYHRHLVVKGVAQEKWQHLCVDMTQARRPDGTGGPLSENERIDDIQFYADAKAELIIDDIMLFDAAEANERRPFPQRVVFTGSFDTGKQGKEWPGIFDIVSDKGWFWRAAKSVPHTESGGTWIRIDLRGQRPLGETTHLAFRYHVTGTERARIVLANRSATKEHIIELNGLKQDGWQLAVLDFAAARGPDGKAHPPRRGEMVEEIHFLLPRGGELLLDEVVLYEAGK
jgi:inosine-uridine nucleoside N-ribohydrolase